jgi:hypothetical protein
VYGVWLDWGLLYVGQTLEAERRLRDLAIGESHHLANTFPPEIWDRVVVVAWSRVPEATTLNLTPQVIGLALEHRLQMEFSPMSNSARRRWAGGFRSVDPARSMSRGAHHAELVSDLYAVVRKLWLAAADHLISELDASIVRVVRPIDMLSQGQMSITPSEHIWQARTPP